MLLLDGLWAGVRRLREIADRTLWLEDGAFVPMDAMAVDPVCGMSVDRAGAAHVQVAGRLWWFCSTACREEFAAAPERVLQGPP